MAEGLDMSSDHCIKIELFRPNRVAYNEILGLATLFIYLEI